MSFRGRHTPGGGIIAKIWIDTIFDRGIGVPKRTYLEVLPESLHISTRLPTTTDWAKPSTHPKRRTELVIAVGEKRTMAWVSTAVRF